MSEIKNIVQIKRGPGQPADGVLFSYELGFDTSEGYLYIGNEAEQAAAQKIKAGYADKANDATNATNATNANQLTTARSIQTNLGSTAAVSFNGTEDVTPGVSGVLSLANGGLGVNASTDAGKTTARANLGINLSNLGVTATAAELNVLDGITATTAELNFVDGVTSAIQTQLNNKVPTSRTVNGKALSANISLTASDVGARSSSWVPTLANLGINASATELNYVDGVTSAIQTQLNNKIFIESKTASIGNNGSSTLSFSGTVLCVMVIIGRDSSGEIISGFWSTATSGRKNYLYGQIGNALDTWATTVTISNKNVTVTRGGSTTLNHYVVAFCKS